MPPQQTPPQKLNDQTPQQTGASSGTAPAPSPQYVQKPIAHAAAPASQAPQNFSGIPLVNIEKERKQTLWLATGSLVVFAVGFVVGFAALLGAALGAFGARKAKLINYNLGFALGLTGLILNAVFYFLALLAG